MPHTSSRKGMARLTEEMKNQSDDPSSISRARVWIKSRTRKNGEPVNKAVADAIEKIKSCESDSQSSLPSNDALSQVLGQDKPGRLRAMGRGITLTKFILSQANDKRITECQNTILELKQTIRMLVNNQGKENRVDEGPFEMGISEKLHEKCDLLDWNGTDEIVAEGRVLSNDPNEFVHQIPMGPNAMKILIEFPRIMDAYLWRTATTMTRVGEAKDMIVAWPTDRVILRTIEQEKEDNMSGSQENKCKLFDWMGSEELAAEGRIHHSDPKQLVNGIPLGPSAMLVSIDIPTKMKAYLWKPTASMRYVGEAIGSKVAWPESKVLIDKANTEASFSPLTNNIFTPKSANSSSNKCKLVDVFGTGNIVAEGRVASIDPKVTVHFVPLGEGAARVWIDVAKVPNARLWRPNDEFEYIEDAIGSTIAWPTANLVMESTSSN